ncbi:tyrosine-type recombinase/integrase [Flavobacterium sp. GCM10027622]|uniref:tyrosine-type recombinase/integrase n=1 Tax=unclassified Flavobacterium TaxID=196869 RepID=UPI003616D178
MTKQTLEQFLHQDYSKQTVKTYLFAIDHFVKMNPKAKRYKYQNIVSYMDEVSQEQSNPRYRVVILSAIKKYYDYLIASGYRTDHPCKRLNIKVNSNHAIQVQDLFSSEELQLLMNRENRYWFLQDRNNVLISLLIYQGLTSDEIKRLELKDVDLDNGTILIKASKNLNRRTLELTQKQMIPISRYINETRKKMLMGQTDKLILNKLGKPISIGGINSIFDQFKGLFPDRDLNPRAIRMSVICNWLNEKKLPLEQVQQLCGHRWSGSTEKYIRVNSQEEVELINKFFPI